MLGLCDLFFIFIFIFIMIKGIMNTGTLVLLLVCPIIFWIIMCNAV